MKTIALIPARSGSRGIPGKNLRILGGQPLLEWSTQAARMAGCFSDIVVSAGSEEIARAARFAGVTAFVRPPQLNADDASMIDVVRNAIEECRWDDDDIVVLLQPTAPFRSSESILRCVHGLSDPERPLYALSLDSSMTVIRVPDRYHPDQIIAEQEPVDTVHGKPRFPVNRQDLEPVYVRAGTVYAFYVRTVRYHGDIYGEDCDPIEVPENEALNLDEMSDWYEAERRAKEDRVAKAAQPSSVQGEEQTQSAAL